MSIDIDRWKEIELQFDDLLECTQEERSDRLAQIAESDPELFRDLNNLFSGNPEHSNLLSKNVFDVFSTFQMEINEINDKTHLKPSSLTGMMLDDYIIGIEIGSGGMGVVYKAKHIDAELNHTVAIKVLYANSPQLKQRFLLEQRALVTLKHPNITQFINTGTTPSGSPYFVMEYVDGLPLLEHCQQQKLDIKGRILLMNQLLDALAFSHRNLVVHRDLKPSNIMVTNEGRIKLLDFGIAKLIHDPKASDLTITRGCLLTPSHSTPEQIQNKPITVATDIYQVGLIYYELLTGRQALEFESDSLSEVVDKICKVDPPKPSTKPCHLKIDRDIDAIILKTLEKRPEDRYDSIGALRSDWNAYLSSKPISAANFGWTYYLSKSIKRNRKTYASLFIFSAISAMYAFSYIHQNTLTKKALDKSLKDELIASEVSNFLASTFTAADPNLVDANKLTAEQLLERGVERIETLTDARNVQATLINTFAEIYYRQSNYQKAHLLYERFFSSDDLVNNVPPLSLAKAKTYFALLKIAMGENLSATELLVDSLDIQGGVTSTELEGETLAALASALLKSNQLEQAQVTANKAVTKLQEFGSELAKRKLAYAYDVQSQIYYSQNQLYKAIESMRLSAEANHDVLGENHSEHAHTLLNLSQMLAENNQLDEAKGLTRQALKTIESLLPPGHSSHIAALKSLAKIEQKSGNLELSLKYISDAIKLIETEEANRQVMSLQLSKVNILLDLNKLEDAKFTIEKYSAIANDKFPQTLLPFHFKLRMGRYLILTENYKNALRIFDDLIVKLEDNPSAVAFISADRGVTHYFLGNHKAAISDLSNSISSFSERYSAGSNYLNALIEFRTLLINASINDRTHLNRNTHIPLNGLPSHLKKAINNIVYALEH